MSTPPPDSLLERLIDEAQADDYALAQVPTGRPSRRSVLVAGLVLVLIGIMFAVAVTQQERTRPGAEQRREQLLNQIEDQRNQIDASEAQAATLRTSVSQLQLLATGGLSQDFADQLQALELSTGFVPLTGPGAIVTLEDGKPPLPKGVAPEEARVLDVDVQSVVNGLWEAGAQAVAINDIRVTSVTAIRTAGEAILVDYRPLVPPYQVTALGPKDLAARFDNSETAKDLAGLRKDYGIRSQTTAVDSAQVPASTANLPVRADVVRGGQQ